MRNRVFHRCSIGGIAFEGIVSADGPCLSSDTGGVALGVSGLRQFQPTRSLRHRPAFGWWVVKYRDEERVALAGFDHCAVRDLSDEFGLVILTERDPYVADHVRQDYFFTSPAWDALRRWVARHPRIAKAHAACDPYLPGWHDRARMEAQALSARTIPLRD